MSNFSFIKRLSGVVGLAAAGIFMGMPAEAQSPYEFELSDEGLVILCERFPLNSRCIGVNPEESGLTDDRNEPSVLDESPSEPDYAPDEESRNFDTDYDSDAMEMDEGLTDDRTEPSVLDESPYEPDYAPGEESRNFDTDYDSDAMEMDEGLTDDRTEPSVLDESPYEPDYESNS